ncbi:MAG: dihydrodipicolinate reductase [Acidimicrobiales bacterium]|nr:dihydrodipicolinate reductase [Acidimicrobiales bacterium]
MSIRVVQWTTGNVAANAVRAVLAHPDLELVGGYAWSADKAGRDLGELVGLDPLGVTATADVDEIIGLRPDVVLYMPLFWDVDQMVKLLEAGINVISTANFITGRSYGDADMKRLHDAAEEGGVSLYGTGISPGLANALALTVAGGVRDLERISIWEEADVSVYESEETWNALGFAQPPDTPGLAEGAKARQLVFQDAVEMMAAALGVDLDDVSHRLDLGLATEDVDLGWMKIPKGTVCGQKGVWTGTYNGRALIEIGLTWWLSDKIEDGFASDAHGHVIEVVGTPSFRVVSEILRPAMVDRVTSTAETAHAAVNAVPAVVAAGPGLVTVADLPLITAGSVAR